MIPFPPFSETHLPCTGQGGRIVVVGGGLGGMTAAYRLRQAGHDVTVLEAADRAGGRNLTLRGCFSEGLHAEAGAAFFLSNHTFLMGFIKELGLEDQLVEIPHTGEDVLYTRTVQQPVPTGGGPLDPVPPGLNREEQQTGPAAWVVQALSDGALTLAGMGDPREPDWPPPGLAVFDDASLYELLIRGGALGRNGPAMGVTEAAYALVSRGYFDLMGEGPTSVASLAQLRDLVVNQILVPEFAPLEPPHNQGGEGPVPLVLHHHHPALRMLNSAIGSPGALEISGHSEALAKGHPPKNYCLKGGNDGLAAAFAKALGEDLILNTRVTEIRSWSDGAEVTALGPDGTRSFQADRVLCAMPVQALDRIRFSEPFPEWKKAALAKYNPTRALRVFFEFGERFWTDRGLSGIASTDLPEVNGDEGRPGIWINNQTGAQPGPGGVLECYVVGDWAESLSALPDDQLRSTMLAQIERVFPGSAEVWTGNWARKYWHDAYAWFAPGEMGVAVREGPRPVGPIHFAGDQYSAIPGWIQGAMESAIKAAKEVNGAMTAGAD